MADAARLLPLLGIFLIFLPVLWQPAQSPEPDTARGGVYLFAVWAVLVSGAFLMSRLLGATVEGDGDGGDGGDGEAVGGAAGEAAGQAPSRAASSGKERSGEEPSGLAGAGEPGRDRRGEAR